MSYHEKQVVGKSVDWLTPESIVRPLGTFDLDPCGHPSQYRMAKRIICLPENGLCVPWRGRVWLNPPFGQFLLPPWIEKLAEHGNGIALVPGRIETQWFHRHVWASASAVFLFRGRVQLSRPGGGTCRRGGPGAGFPSVLVAYGRANVKAITKANFKGQLIELRNQPAADAAKESEDES